ncbi:MAG: hypothetical protein RW306_14160 [Geobacteraceae bacterium]|nr:hypothetical protein [Geobacteraceae bacterium]
MNKIINLLLINLSIVLSSSLCWGNQDVMVPPHNACVKNISESSTPIADIKKCEKVAQSTINRNEKAKALLFLGRMHLQLPNALMYRFFSAPSSKYFEGEKKFKTFCKTRPNEYYSDEVSGSYIYNGHHFNTIIAAYSETEFVDDAAFEIAKLPQGGECEGWLDCYLENPLKPLCAFLKKYPYSPLAKDAVSTANLILKNTLDMWLGEIKTPINYKVPSEGYNPDAIKTTLHNYEDSLSKLQKEDRVSAYMAIASAWSRLTYYSEAKLLYLSILKEISEHDGAKKALKNLPAGK